MPFTNNMSWVTIVKDLMANMQADDVAANRCFTIIQHDKGVNKKSQHLLAFLVSHPVILE
jgi:hypothetical protein